MLVNFGTPHSLSRNQSLIFFFANSTRLAFYFIDQTKTMESEHHVEFLQHSKGKGLDGLQMDTIMCLGTRHPVKLTLEVQKRTRYNVNTRYNYLGNGIQSEMLMQH